MLLLATVFNAYQSEIIRVLVVLNIMAYTHFQVIQSLCIIYKNISMQTKIWGTSLCVSHSILARIIEGYQSKQFSAPMELSQTLVYRLEHLAVKIYQFKSHIAFQLQKREIPGRATVELQSSLGHLLARYLSPVMLKLFHIFFSGK